MHMTPKLRKQRVQVHRRKGQSIVEFALGSILLVMLLATAIDIGRAFFTWEVVHNMAAEGAAYLSRFPDNDNAAATVNTYQGRVMNVGLSSGRLFDRNNINPATGITASVAQNSRCMGTQFKVTVNYSMTDLFIPAFFGVKTLNLGAEETSAFLASSDSATCP
jgi:Flp pilus assembly protein TadG